MFIIECEQEDDGRWIAEIPALPGVMVYGISRDDAQDNAKSLALRVLADRLERGHRHAALTSLFSVRE